MIESIEWTSRRAVENILRIAIVMVNILHTIAASQIKISICMNYDQGRKANDNNFHFCCL